MLLFTLSIIAPLYAQEQKNDYVPFPMENAEWINIRKSYEWGDQQTIHFTANETVNILDNVYYKIIYDGYCEDYNEFYIRETEDKKVFAIFPQITDMLGYEKEILLYDFGVEVGDTIFFEYTGMRDNKDDCTWFYYYPHNFIVTEIRDYELYNGQIRKALKIDGRLNDLWVEGFGSPDFLLGVYQLENLLSDMISLTCFYHNDELLYKQKICFDCLCFNSIEDHNISADLSIYPNPSNDLLCVEFSDYQIKDITIFDITGKEIQTINNVNSNITNVNITNLAKGIYNLRINTACGNTACGKFVKE
ncbi:T9SS type A sorting domain-containing protein [Bacteroidales bacterium OttesenSCG-928-K03]|nr:T9SS type A sorting domain-containing protein [Bacteroidales bacterium OttesenSCG-928-K03]